MEQFIGLDVSLKDTFISVREGGHRIWRGKCPSDPKLIAEVIRKRAPHAERVVFETGPLSVWFYHALQPRACRRSALMPVMPRRRSTWRATRPMPTMQTASRIWAKSAFTARCA